jgi:hypothetical protein
MTLARLALTSLLLTALSLTSGCVVRTHDRVVDHDSDRYAEGYREGYYDREHHRWWHEHAWRDCVEHDEHCPD